MDTSAEYKKLLEKKAMNAPVTWRDIAVAIANHEETLLQYLTDNDFPQVYRLLHHSAAPMTIHSSRGGADFFPDKDRAEGELKMLLAKKDFATLNDIVSNFRINMQAGGYSANPNLITAMKDIDLIKADQNGLYYFNVKLH